MKSVKKILAMCLAIMMIVSCIPAAHAADVPNTAIDLDAKGSLTLYKYDLTNVPAIMITALILAMARLATVMP